MIKSRIKAERSEANLSSYDQAYRSFSWAKVEEEFAWKGPNLTNIAFEAIDRHVPDRAHIKALILEKAGKTQSFTYLDLRRISCQWANLLSRYGLTKGDRLFIYLDPCPELYFAMIACARMGVVFCPLYPTLVFDELEDRIRNAAPTIILTHPDLAENLPPEAMADVEHVLLTEGPSPGLFRGESVIENLAQEMPDEFETVWVERDARLYLLYTSGSTGPPKGVVHSHQDMLGLKLTAKYVLELNEGTLLWTDGHPAWVLGTMYGTFAPWLCGATSIVMADPFSASSWYRTLEKHKVEVWYTTPSRIRKLMDAGEDLPPRYDFSNLRHICTVGEALGPELFHWVRGNIGLSPHDTWWMTETGMICLANFPSMDVKPGSMGKPVPGVEAAIVSEDGEKLPMLTLGQLALKPGWPAMMREIWQDKLRYRAYFRLPGWFLTGDMAIVDEDGYFFHQGRMDDLIKFGEKIVGPYEIEQVLCRHPAVHEAAVISKEVSQGKSSLKAFVTVSEGYKPSMRLRHEIRAFLRSNISSAVQLNEVDFISELPKTRSGKLLRRVLRARELGLPEGDLLGLQDEPFSEHEV
ncbi:MAG: AMP-binding protein [Desulfomonilaceae bacterium]